MDGQRIGLAQLFHRIIERALHGIEVRIVAGTDHQAGGAGRRTAGTRAEGPVAQLADADEGHAAQRGAVEYAVGDGDVVFRAVNQLAAVRLDDRGIAGDGDRRGVDLADRGLAGIAQNIAFAGQADHIDQRIVGLAEDADAAAGSQRRRVVESQLQRGVDIG